MEERDVVFETAKAFLMQDGARKNIFISLRSCIYTEAGFTVYSSTGASQHGNKISEYIPMSRPYSCV